MLASDWLNVVRMLRECFRNVSGMNALDPDWLMCESEGIKGSRFELLFSYLFASQRKLCPVDQ